MDGVIPICVVDEILPTVWDDLLGSNSDGGANANKTRHTFLAQSLQSNDDLYAPMTKPATAFTSPFLNMTFDDIHNAIRLKSETLQAKSDMSQEVFIIVDDRSAKDNTVWLCRVDKNHQRGWPPELSQPLRVRAQMNVASLHGRDLQNNKTTMRRLCARAAMEKGVLVTPPELDEEEKQGEEEKEEGEEEEEGDQEDDDSLDSDFSSQSTQEWGDVWRGRWCR